MGRFTADPTTQPWQQLADTTRDLLQQLTSSHGESLDMQRFAKTYEALAHGFLAATRSEGHSSLRMEAVIKALDLRTKKSALEAFVHGNPTLQ
ncbi:MAG: hypothetical protein R3C68_12205 [Myxococcota bacterium]